MKNNSTPKYKPKDTMSSISNSVVQNNPQCFSTGCIAKPISRCTVCSNYYCYEHVYEHPHAMENVEIL